MTSTPGPAVRAHRGPIFVPDTWLERRVGLYPIDVVGPTNMPSHQAARKPTGHVQITKKAALAIIRLKNINITACQTADGLTLKQRASG